MPDILLVEDDATTAREITLELEASGYGVRHAATGEAAMECARLLKPDLMIVDRRLPDRDGLDVIASLKAEGVRTPMLVLSALGALNERVRGLRAGGDDYLAKPFAFVELIARIEALLRRPGEARETRLVVGPVDLDLMDGTARRNGRAIELLNREFQLLEYLVRREGSVVTRSMLLRDVWGYDFEPKSNVVDVHMSRLRRKVDVDGEIPLIRSVRGQGFTFRVHN